jgi:hypothetical protein
MRPITCSDISNFNLSIITSSFFSVPGFSTPLSQQQQKQQQQRVGLVPSAARDLALIHTIAAISGGWSTTNHLPSFMGTKPTPHLLSSMDLSSSISLLHSEHTTCQSLFSATN